MIFVSPGPVSTAVFLLIVFLVLAAFLGGYHLACRRLGLPAPRKTLALGLGTLAYLGLASLAVASGVVESRPMPGLPVFFLAFNLVAVVTALSPVGRRLADGLPLAALVGFQAFRLPLELVLHTWARQGAIPETMTWSGANFDIVSGVVAALAAPLVFRFRAAAWIADAIGFALLLNVFRVALFSSPLPFAWKVYPPLTLAFHLPYALIGPVCVAGALAGHIVLTRALIAAAKRA